GRVDERDTQLVLAQGAGDRSTHDTGSDNGDVKIHAWSIRVRSASTAARHCRRKFLASASLHAGSKVRLGVHGTKASVRLSSGSSARRATVAAPSAVACSEP